jgi:hypothetical protein
VAVVNVWNCWCLGDGAVLNERPCGQHRHRN